MSRANMDKNPDEVAAMFDGVAKRYDLVNDLLSLGQTKIWRKRTTEIIDPKSGMQILDWQQVPVHLQCHLLKLVQKLFPRIFPKAC